jgi:hypothetical protein
MEINSKYLEQINNTEFNSFNFPLSYSTTYTNNFHNQFNINGMIGGNSHNYLNRRNKFMKFKRTIIERGTKINPVIRNEINYFDLELEVFKMTNELFKEYVDKVPEGINKTSLKKNKLFYSEWM